MVTIVTAGTAGAASVKHHTSQIQGLKAGLAFYRGKQVTLIAPDAPGGTFDIESRILAPAVGRLLHANVSVENIAPGVTVAGQDALAASNPNGLTFGWLNTYDLSLIATKTPGLNFNPVREAFLGSTYPIPFVFISSSSTYSKWSEVQNSTSPVKILDLSSVGGATNAIVRTVAGAFGLRADILSGYPSQAALLQGFVRGDGPITALSPLQVIPMLHTHKASALLLSGPIPKSYPYASLVAGVPTIAQWAKTHRPRSAQQKRALSALLDLVQNLSNAILAAPGKTPNDRVVALRWAIHKALTTGSVERAELAQDMPTGYLGGAALKRTWLQASKLIPALVPYIMPK